jgi:hypothetical protein
LFDGDLNLYTSTARADGREAQELYFGLDGIIYADQRRRELLDEKIKTLELELARLKRLRRSWGP